MRRRRGRKSEMAARTTRARAKAKDYLLAALCLFERMGAREVSLAALSDCIVEAKKELPLDYPFAEKAYFSASLFQDLAELEFRGYLDEYRYIHDSYLPKTYYRLTWLGKGRGTEAASRLAEAGDDLEKLRRAVVVSLQNEANRWRLWRRPSPS